MNINEVAAQLEGHAAALLETAKKLRGVSDPPTPVAAEKPKDDAPFGRRADGTPKEAPAFDKCHALREAGQVAGVFDIHKFIGVGIQQGAAQMYSGHVTDWAAVEEAIVDLGKSDWGQGWLSVDENAELIHSDYLKRFRGYTVERVYDKFGDLVGYKRIIAR